MEGTVVMEIKNVGVVGCGLMGSGIAQVAAQAGMNIVAHEVEQELLEKAFGRIRKFLDGGVAKEKTTQEAADAAFGRLRGVVDLEELRDSDIVVEAATENIAVKKEVMSALDRICPDHTILASNTSSLSITEMAGFTDRPDRFLGLHFFNPVPLMKLVEVVKTVRTSPETVETGVGFARALGKTPILTKDSPGFVVNLLLVPYLLDSIRALEKGVASLEDIETGMKLGTGYPMGPFTLLDFVGLDTTYYIANIMFDEFKSPQYAPPTLLKRMVHAGYLGRKSGKGFFDYGQDPPKPTEGLS
jgi:3-hydroxybutyryl-CoA dehydrogenase